MERKEITKTGKRLEEKEGCGKGKDGGKEGEKKKCTREYGYYFAPILPNVSAMQHRL